MTVDWGVAANIITIMVYIVGGFRFLGALQNKINILVAERESEHKSNLEKFEHIADQLKKLTDVIVRLAVQEERLVALDQRIVDLTGRVETLKIQRDNGPALLSPPKSKRRSG